MIIKGYEYAQREFGLVNKTTDLAKNQERIVNKAFCEGYEYAQREFASAAGIISGLKTGASNLYNSLKSKLASSGIRSFIQGAPGKVSSAAGKVANSAKTVKNAVEDGLNQSFAKEGGIKGIANAFKKRFKNPKNVQKVLNNNGIDFNYVKLMNNVNNASHAGSEVKNVVTGLLNGDSSVAKKYGDALKLMLGFNK